MDIHNALTSPSTVAALKVEQHQASKELAVQLNRQPSELKVVSSNPLPRELGAGDFDHIDQMNQRLVEMGVGVTFAVDQDTGSSIVKVIDKTSNEVMKQFPSEDALRMMRNIQNYLDSATQTQLSDAKGLTGSLINEII
ncbi:flagellar protein FlaG [Thiomicrospira microaerophila]|uniref:flagellar protein FlaG n=1 Tax=Thiomicrospira microaerophila TaxID=406020 RepID=UPI00200D1219|nr:flagellar protein FlaG [Thiomicrospira microaerophila]UQB42717.1 flagellar protein FlaG [Thiomicrospira microaerophila]